MLHQAEVDILEELAVAVAQPIAGGALGGRLFQPKVVQLSAHSSQPLAYFGHRIASAKNAEKHGDQLRLGLVGFVVMVGIMLFDQAAYAYGIDQAYNLLKDRLSG